MSRYGSARVWQTVLSGALLVSSIALSCSSPDRRFGEAQAGTSGAGFAAHAGVEAVGGTEAEGGSGGSDDLATSAGENAGGSADPGGSGGEGGSDDASGGVPAGGVPAGGSSGRGGAASGGSAGGDVAPPTVVSVSPTGTGVTKSAAIVVNFSEPMKTSSAGAVTLSSGGTAVALNPGVWSANNTTLTLQPTSELAYAVGEDPLTAKSFTITVQTSAQDASGNALSAAYSSSFSSLRRLQTLVTLSQQAQYFDAESTYANPAAATFWVSRQVGGNGYEDQYYLGLVGFDKANATLTTAASTAESVALELYATTALSAASLTFQHVNSSDLTNAIGTLIATKPTTSVTITSFGAASSWWSVDVTPIFKHASFNLASYYSLQFLLKMEAPGSAAGVTKSVTFVGGSATTNKPRLRVTRLIP